MKKTVFLLEDDESISGLVKVALQTNGINCAVFSSCEEFKTGLHGETPAVALLDVMLPDGSGFEVLEYVKRVKPQVSCIILSALSSEASKVGGLNLGADDYITKPFSVLELIARVNAALRRQNVSSVITSGNLTVDLDKMSASLNDKELPLNRKEFELLSFLVQNSGKVMSRETILTKVWGYDTGETRTLDNHVARLRKVGVSNIKTVFGVGYQFTENDE